MDSTPLEDEGQEHLGVKKAFINATIVEESGKKWVFEEGCLSIPGVQRRCVSKRKFNDSLLR